MDATTRNPGGTIVTGGHIADTAVDCTSPYTAEVGEYAHRLVIPGTIHPTNGEQRLAFSRTWQWDSECHGWKRIS
jgi:hypothetical protein